MRFAHHGWHSLRFQINGKQLTFMYRHAISAVNWRMFFLSSLDLLERTPKKINPMGVRGREPDCLEFLLNKFALSKAEIAFPWQTLLLGQFCPKLSPHAIFLIMRVKLELMVPSRKAISNLSLECALCFSSDCGIFPQYCGWSHLALVWHRRRAGSLTVLLPLLLLTPRSGLASVVFAPSGWHSALPDASSVSFTSHHREEYSPIRICLTNFL